MVDASDSPLLERLEQPPRRRLVGPVLGLLAGLAAAGALTWWLTADPGQAPRNVSAAQLAQAGRAQPASPQPAAASADEALVRRAYEQFQVVYADLGVDGLEDFSRNCARTVPGTPRIIDYCLAFDTFAAAVAADRPWFTDADLRHVDLARAALPEGADPAQRVAEVARLTRRATGAPVPVDLAEETPPSPAPSPASAPASPPSAATPAAPPPAVQRAAAPQASAARPKLQRTVARPAAKAAASRKGTARCGLEATPAARVLCEHPDLRTADRRLKRAYEQALAAGADPQELDRQQAEWRTAQNAYAGSKDALARSYQLRIGQLEAYARTAER